MTIVQVLLGVLVGCGIVLAASWRRSEGRSGPVRPTVVQLAVGFVTNFFDTLGIGSFATTTAAFRLMRSCRTT